MRIDSGDLAEHAKKVRKILDDHGSEDVLIVASSDLNEFKIKELIDKDAPIDIFGVGTDLVTSHDCPSLDLTYKLVQTKDRGNKIKFRAKKSPKKQTIPGKKQVFRTFTKNTKNHPSRVSN